MGARIGERVCLYPNGGDPMMTEPDLVTVEDLATVDNASLVAHINTRGVFDLNRLHVGRGAVLRSHSRLLSGATMRPFSTMLEHTLVVRTCSCCSHCAPLATRCPLPCNHGGAANAGTCQSWLLLVACSVHRCNAPLYLLFWTSGQRRHLAGGHNLAGLACPHG